MRIAAERESGRKRKMRKAWEVEKALNRGERETVKRVPACPSLQIPEGEKMTTTGKQHRIPPTPVTDNTLEPLDTAVVTRV